MTATSLGLASFPSDKEIMMSRTFDAPRELVFQVMIDPAMIPNWWGPRRLTTTVDKMDVRPGGVWRFVQHDSDGNEFAFNGAYQEIVPPERIVQTFEFEMIPGHVVLETMTLQEIDGKTTVTVVSLFQSVEDRDGMFNSGMEAGASESYDRLEELLESISAENE